MRTAKDRARAHVAYHLRIGAIRRPPACEECQSLGNVEAHHPDYGQPGHVVWLCRACHAAKRRRFRSGAVAMIAMVLFFGVVLAGCATYDQWAANMEAAGYDVPAIVEDTATTVGVLLPSPWREILIGIAGIGGIIYQTVGKKRLQRELSGR